VEAKNGVAKQHADVEKRALYTHCYCHVLKLAIADTMKQSKVCRDQWRSQARGDRGADSADMHTPQNSR